MLAETNLPLVERSFVNILQHRSQLVPVEDLPFMLLIEFVGQQDRPIEIVLVLETGIPYIAGVNNILHDDLY